MAANISFAFAKQAFRKSLRRRHHNRTIFNCNIPGTFFDLSVYSACIWTATHGHRHAGAESMEALMGGAQQSGRTPDV
jgi:hypothetical protein